MLYETKDCPKCKGDITEFDCDRCDGIGFIESPIEPETIVYVNIYSITRHYGGPEEGGWYYNWDNCIESIPVRNKYSETMKEEVEKHYAHRKHGNIYSVLGGTDIQVRIEEFPKESETKERPHYE